MNDLLASLVDRALDRAPVLQRRQPTLFEPIAEASFSEQPQFGNTPPLEEKEIVVESPPSLERQKLSVNAPLLQPPPRREEPESQPVETRPIRPRRVDDTPPPQIDQDNAPVSAGPRKVEAIRLEEPRRESRTPVVTKPEEITVAPKRLIETIVERRVEREVIKEHATKQPAINEVHAFTQPISPPKPTADDRDSEPKPVLKAGVKRPAPPKDETTIKPLVKQNPVPRRDVPPYIRAVARAESRHSQKQETPPVIHVTIGRVEVRATPAATNKPRSARPAGPKMTLEDYLSSRSKGNQ